MSEKRAIARNALWNILGTGVEAVTGFVLAPLLIHTLGNTRYGLWIVLGSLAGYFGLFDLGFRSSIGRYVAFHHAKEDQPGINQVLSTALLFLGIGAILALVGLLAVIPFLDRWFDIPPEQIDDARLALAVVALNLALSFIVNAFDATLWGFQRFDLLNSVDIPASLIRLGLTVVLISTNQQLVTLALINLAVIVSVGLAKGTLCWYQNPALRISFQGIQRQAARDLFGFGAWSFLYSVNRTVRAQLSPVLIGATLGISLTTPYSVAGRLVNQVAVVIAACTGILTPFATRLHAREQIASQQRLFILGGRSCMILTLFLTGGLVLLGKPLITLWVGSKLVFAANVLTVLLLGEILPNSQFVTTGIIFAKARQNLLACLGIVETIAVAGLTIWWVQWYGLIGAAFAVALPGLVCRGIPQILQGCYLTGVSLPSYLLKVYVIPLAYLALPVLALFWAVTLEMPETWAALILYAFGYTLVFGLSLVPLVGLDTLLSLLAAVTGKKAPLPMPSSSEEV